MATFQNPVEFANLGVFVGQVDAFTAPQGPSTISGVTALQTLNVSTDVPLEDVGYAGVTATQKVNNETPTVSLDFSFFALDLYNEAVLGFTIDSTNSCLTRILQRDVDERNYWVPISDPGIDLKNTTPADYQVLAIGNGFVSSYSTEASVGSFATTSVSVQGGNIAAYADGVAQILPPIDSDGLKSTGTFTLPNGISTISGQPTVIGQGDIVLEITANAANALFYNPTGLCIQGYNISFDLNRTPIQCLGSKYPRSRKASFPIGVDMSIDALGGDLTTGSLADILCNAEENQINLAVSLHEPNCTDTRGPAVARYELKGAVFQGFSSSASQGDDQGQTITLNYQGSISASGDLDDGLFLSGVYGYNGGTGIYST